MDTFEYFRQICRIPRASGNEEGMRKFILDWAKTNKFEAFRDETGNIIVRCPATKGFENRKSVCLQGHMDMVCVKEDNCVHDFEKDPIEVYEDGDFLRAKGTSLGGDNGIAVAMAMALFTDPSAKHGPLEALFTYNEEVGLTGAFNVHSHDILSRQMINLDSEEEGVIYIGCAGGIDAKARFDCMTTSIPAGYKTYELSVSGLRGGHSGGEIHHQRINSIKAVGRLLASCLEEGTDIRVCSLNGGTRRNVIPSTAKCVFTSSVDVSRTIERVFNEIASECKYDDPDFEYSLSESSSVMSFSEESSKNLIKLICSLPHGVFKYSHAVNGVVETSDNLAIVTSDKVGVNFEISVRSLIDTAKVELVNSIKYIFESFGAKCEIGDGYPSWTPNPESELAKFCAKAYREKTGKDAVITSIHAGLECGIINSLVPGLDSVSIGPDLFDVHSTNEHLSISSVKRTYEFVKHLVEIID